MPNLRRFISWMSNCFGHVRPIWSLRPSAVRQMTAHKGPSPESTTPPGGTMRRAKAMRQPQPPGQESAFPEYGCFKRHGGKMIFYQGWSDGDAYPGAVIDYFREMVKTTFGGDYAAASRQGRVFAARAIGHCSSRLGPNEWDKVAPPGHAKVDHERKLCL